MCYPKWACSPMCYPKVTQFVGECLQAVPNAVRGFVGSSRRRCSRARVGCVIAPPQVMVALGITQLARRFFECERSRFGLAAACVSRR